MPIISTSNPDLTGLKGIHLWHAGLSTCSQRVRITLAELDLRFESHIVNLHAGENATEWYQAIHPQGLVPALVHNGRLVIDSVDIIGYLDQELGKALLTPIEPEKVKVMHELMQRADRAQKHLKLLTFEFLFRAGPPPSNELVTAFQSNHRNEKLKAFHREFQTGFERSRIEQATAATDRDFRILEESLGDGREFLAGPAFSLADIAWTPNFHRFDLIRWPFERYPNLQRWFNRISSRSSYDAALESWEPRELLDNATPRLKARQASGDGIESYLM